VLGIIIGLAVIVPGVSGSTVAIMFGMYAALLYAIGNIFNDFRRCLLYLLPIGLGAVVGFLGGFLIIQKVFGRYMFIVVCLFAGLMCGAVPALTAEIKGEKRSVGRLFLAALGVIIPIAVGAVSILLSNGESADASGSFTAFPVYLFLLYIPLGAVVSATQIIPGLSATAILMACGQFAPILNSLHLDYILENPEVLGLYICIGGGFLGGIVLISRMFSKIIEKHRAPTFFLVVGLSLGSILSMFLNTDMWEIYGSWGEGKDPTVSIIVGVALMIAGFACSLALTKYELKKRD
jgi:putative membrane protein